MGIAELGISKDLIYFLFWGVFGLANFWAAVYLIIHTIKEVSKKGSNDVG